MSQWEQGRAAERQETKEDTREMQKVEEKRSQAEAVEIRPQNRKMATLVFATSFPSWASQLSTQICC